MLRRGWLGVRVGGPHGLLRLAEFESLCVLVLVNLKLNLNLKVESATSMPNRA